MTFNLPRPKDRRLPKDLVEKDPLLLQQAVENLVRFGQQVGVTPEDMISLLDSGISIHDLLGFLASKTSGVA
jgi:hypothetical protein